MDDKLPQLNKNQSNDSMFFINAEVLLKEFTCTICFCLIEDCHITKCGHDFCKECILEAINRRHRCPFCQTELNDGDIIKNYHFINIKKIIMDEKEKATKEYINRIFDNDQQKKEEQKYQENPIEQLFKKYLKETILLYQNKFIETENTFKQRKEKVHKDYMKKIAQFDEGANIQKIAKEENDIMNYELAQLDQQTIQINQFYLESLEKNLKVIIPNPELLDIRVSIRVPLKNIYIEGYYIKPNSFIKDFKNYLEDYFIKKNDPITEFKEQNVFLVILPFIKIKDYQDIILQNKMLNFDTLQMLLAQFNDQDVQLKPMSCNEMFINMKLQQGSQIIVLGQFQTKQDLPAECMTYSFNGQMVLDYYYCEQCKINWICPGCKDFCHKGHTTQSYLKNHTATWACCYCVSKGFCKAMNKNNKKK